jgi:hypothetical protein
MSNLQTNNWYQALTDRVNTLSEEFGLDDMQTVSFRDFVVGLAREQYRVGNKSGISWAFKRAREEAGKSLEPQPVT